MACSLDFTIHFSCALRLHPNLWTFSFSVRKLLSWLHLVTSRGAGCFSTSFTMWGYLWTIPCSGSSPTFLLGLKISCDLISTQMMFSKVSLSLSTLVFFWEAEQSYSWISSVHPSDTYWILFCGSPLSWPVASITVTLMVGIHLFQHLGLAQRHLHTRLLRYLIHISFLVPLP